MLVTFTTSAYAEITTFGDNALALLKMMGHSATVPGAFRRHGQILGRVHELEAELYLEAA